MSRRWLRQLKVFEKSNLTTTWSSGTDWRYRRVSVNCASRPLGSGLLEQGSETVSKQIVRMSMLSYLHSLYDVFTFWQPSSRITDFWLHQHRSYWHPWFSQVGLLIVLKVGNMGSLWNFELCLLFKFRLTLDISVYWRPPYWISDFQLHHTHVFIVTSLYSSF